jgi:hypothetical protein
VVLHPTRVVLESPEDEFLVGLLLESEGEEGDLLVVEEVVDVAVGTFPLLLVARLQNHSFLRVGNVDLIFELTFLHAFEDRHVADGRPQRTDVQLALIPHLDYQRLYTITARAEV